MTKEVTNQDILRAIIEISESQHNLEEKLTLTEKKLSGKIDSTKVELNQKIDVTKAELNQKIDSIKVELNQRIDSTKVELKEAISNVENKVDLVDSHLYVQAGDLSRTKAEVKMLQDAKS